jgi:hypothetical protein
MAWESPAPAGGSVAEVDETYRSLTNDSGELLDVRGEPAVGGSYRSLDFVFERGVLSLA